MPRVVILEQHIAAFLFLHLEAQAMCGNNFAFFDPNIWWNEDEMRKQVEQLHWCCVLTGWAVALM